MKKTLAATTAVVILTAAATFVTAQDMQGHDGERHGGGAGHRMLHNEFGDPTRMVEMMKRHLDLDDTQSQTIDNIFSAAKPEIDALRERAKSSRDAMRDLDVDATDYGSSLQNLSADIGALTTEAMLLHGRLRADVYAALTPEQREQAAAGRAGMRGHFRRHRRSGQE